MKKLTVVSCAVVALTAALAACSDSVLTSPSPRAPLVARADVSPAAVLSTTAVCSNGSVTVATHAGIPPLPGSFSPALAAVVPGTINPGWHAAISGSSWIIPNSADGNGPYSATDAPDFVSSHYSVGYSVPSNAVSPTIVGTSYADNQVTAIFIDNNTGGTSLGANATLSDAGNYNGAAPLSWGGATPTGNHTLDFYVANNNVDQPTNPTALDFCFHVEYTLPPPPAPALFVIGDDQLHAIGDIVNFWGAQWWKNNPTSITSDNGWESFKGFAPVSGTCGQQWSSGPGNSDPPPAAPLPSSINIIVTDKVNKNGNTLFGNIVEIITVTQDGHYDANPGHAGNGTVTAVVCPPPV